jgi:hypothetical protein
MGSNSISTSSSQTPRPWRHCGCCAARDRCQAPARARCAPSSANPMLTPHACATPLATACSTRCRGWRRPWQRAGRLVPERRWTRRLPSCIACYSSCSRKRAAWYRYGTSSIATRTRSTRWLGLPPAGRLAGCGRHCRRSHGWRMRAAKPVTSRSRRSTAACFLRVMRHWRIDDGYRTRWRRTCCCRWRRKQRRRGAGASRITTLALNSSGRCTSACSSMNRCPPPARRSGCRARRLNARPPAASIPRDRRVSRPADAGAALGAQARR